MKKLILIIVLILIVIGAFLLINSPDKEEVPPVRQTQISTEKEIPKILLDTQKHNEVSNLE